MSTKILITGIGIALAAAALFLWFRPMRVNHQPTPRTATTTPDVVTTTPDNGEFSSWHTYNYPAFNYQFEYPAAYDDSEQYTGCAVTQSDNGLNIGSRSYIQTDPDTHLTLDQFIKKTFADHAEENWKVEDRNETTVGGEKAVTVEYRFGALNRLGKLTFVHYGAHFYTFSFEAGAFACGDEPSVYEHILQTFKWVDEAAEYYKD